MNAMTDPNTYLEKFNESDKLGSLLGTRAISVSDTECIYEYETATEHFNPNGMLHGGTLFTVMDSSQGAFLHFFLDKKYECAATGTATIRFFKPVHAGRITVKTTLQEQKSRRFNIVSRAYDQTGAEIACLEEIWIGILRK